MARAPAPGLPRPLDAAPAWLEPAARTPALVGVWRALVRRHWSILGVTLPTVAAALLMSLLTTPLYRGSVLLQIDPNSEQGPEQGHDPSPAAPRDGADRPTAAPDNRDFYETQYALLASRTLARRVIDQLGLTRSQTQTAATRLPVVNDLIGAGERLLADLTRGRSAPAPAPAPDLEDIFLDNLTVTPVGNSRLVRVAFLGESPTEAAAVAQALAENFVNSGLERRYQASAPARAFLDDRLRAAQAELQDARHRLAAYARAHGIIDLDGQRALLLERLRDLDRQQAEAEAARLATPAAPPGPAGASTAAADDPAIARLQERKAELNAHYQQQLKVFKPGYPKMQQIRQELAELERRLRVATTASGSAARAEVRARAQQEVRLAERAAELRAQLLDLQERGSGYLGLARAVADHQQRYDGLLARAQALAAAAGPGTNPIAIVDPAQVPRTPYRPDLRENLTLALALGLLGGIALAAVRESLDDRLRTLDAVQRQVGAPVLAQIPWERAAPPGTASAPGPWSDPGSALGEALRTLRIALDFATPVGAPRVMHVTGSAAHEGKTSAACATAIAVAATGSRVLLIDADLRRPGLHLVFERPNALGLSDCLTGSAPPLIQPTAVAGLSLLTAGPRSTQPVELLADARMGELIAALGTAFDYLILDGPPVLDLADALVLARLADATLMAATVGTTRAGDLARAMQRLRIANANILGAILITPGDGGAGPGYGSRAPDREAAPRPAALPPAPG